MPEDSSRSAGGRTLGDYLRVLWRWKWMILIIVCASTLAAYVYSWRQAPQYMATASLLYVEPVDPSNPLGGSYYSSSTKDLAIENVLSVVQSSEIVDRAQADLQGDVDSPYGVSASARVGSGSGSMSMGGVVDVSATSGNPDEAAAVATAYAQAIADWRKAQQVERISTAEQAVTASLSAFATEASRQTSDYLMLKQKLQNLKLLETTARGDFNLISEAAPPSSPFAPQPRKAALLGMGVGLLVGVGLAFLLEPLTTKVRGKHEAAEVLGLPVVGSLPEFERRSLHKGRLVALTDPHGQTAEALRLLRSNLDYFNVDKASSLLVTSALAGEGKSTMVCNLAVTMTLAGREVVVVDGDIRRPRVHEYFGLPNDVGLSSVIMGDVALADALNQVELKSTIRLSGNDSRPDGDELAVGTRVPVVLTQVSRDSGSHVAERAGVTPTLLVLTAGPQVPDPGELVASERFGDVIRSLQSGTADLVIVDSPALMEVGDAAAMAAQIEALVVVVDLKKAHHSTLLEMRHLLAPLPCKQLGAVLVRTKSRSSGYGYYS